MVKNRDYPLYTLEEYESLSQMVCRKAEECETKVAFQYMRGKTIHSVTYRQYLDAILTTGKYLSEHCSEETYRNFR